MRNKTTHDWQKYFAESTDPEEFFKQFRSNKEYFEKKYNTKPKVDMHAGRACTEEVQERINSYK